MMEDWLKPSVLETRLIEYHRIHDPVFDLVARHITNPDIFRRELAAAQVRYEARMSSEPGFNPQRPEWMDEMLKGESAPAAPAPTTIRDWQKAIHEYAKEKGWWLPEKPRSFGDLCALFHTEISEAFEEHRAGHALTKVYENPDKPGKLEGVPVELADLVIRVLDFCEWAGIDLQEVMARKHAFNLTRPYRHGNKTV